MKLSLPLPYLQASDLEYSSGGGLRPKGMRKVSTPNAPLISIITVVLNGKKDIEKAIQSVAAQSYHNVELIIVDGGSTDGTLEILSKYNDKIDFWMSGKDGGIYDAMNKALQFSTGDWVLYLGADDVLVNCLEQVASRLTNHNQIYYGDVYWKGFHELYAGEFSAWKITQSNICQQAIFYPRHIFKDYQFNPRYKVCADHYLNLQCYSDNRFSFCYLPILVTIYSNEGFSTGNTDPVFAKDVRALVKERFDAKIYYPFILKKWLIDITSFLGIRQFIKKTMGIKH
ncbi:MAG: glycosyltransferase family 2 protein [Burkholderiales bacterium]